MSAEHKMRFSVTKGATAQDAALEVTQQRLKKKKECLRVGPAGGDHDYIIHIDCLYTCVVRVFPWCCAQKGKKIQ